MANSFSKFSCDEKQKLGQELVQGGEETSGLSDRKVHTDRNDRGVREWGLLQEFSPRVGERWA